MTHLLKPLDFYLTLDNFLARRIYENAPQEELDYIGVLLEKWDKIRFAETSQYAFSRIRVLAGTISDGDYTDTVVALIDAHVDKCLYMVDDAYANSLRGMVGIFSASGRGASD